MDRRKNKTFRKHQFSYDASADVYHCPAGQVLKRQHSKRVRGKQGAYYYNREACAGCALLSRCTGSKYFRRIWRLHHAAVAERAAARLAGRPEVFGKRKAIVEHVYGTLRQWGHDTFLMRGLEKVRGEFSLSALVSNLKRVLSLKTIEDLRVVLKRAAATLKLAGV